MRQNKIQDIVRTKHPSSFPLKREDITSTSRARTRSTKHEKKEEIEQPVEESRPRRVPPQTTETRRSAPKSGGRKGTWLIVVALLFIGGLYFVLDHFASAKIYVTEKTEAYSLKNETFTATRDTGAPLHFEFMLVSDTEQKEVVRTDTKNVNSKAKGTVVIYNAFSTTPQKLLINTRLADDGKRIYFTDKAVTIPGYTTTGGKIVPGSIEVGITATAAGESYNGTPRDFSIVGFAGTAKATKIYARSKSSLTGGASGVVYITSPSDAGEASSLSSVLKLKLEKQLIAQVPPGYILYPGSMQFTANIDTSSLESRSQNAPLVVEGMLKAAILKEDELVRAIVREAYPNVTEAEIPEIQTPELRDLVFTWKDSAAVFDRNTRSIAFTLSGDGTLIWHPDLEALREKLPSVSKVELDQIFATDPGIAHARVVLRPPWKKKLPEDVQRIHVLDEK